MLLWCSSVGINLEISCHLEWSHWLQQLRWLLTQSSTIKIYGINSDKSKWIENFIEKWKFSNLFQISTKKWKKCNIIPNRYSAKFEKSRSSIESIIFFIWILQIFWYIIFRANQFYIEMHLFGNIFACFYEYK